MKKFLVLYKAPTSGFEQMKTATPEQHKAGMEAWMAWGKKAQGAIVDMGAPLGKGMRVTKAGQATPISNDLGGYSVLQAESKEELDLFVDAMRSIAREDARRAPALHDARGLHRDRRDHAHSGHVTRAQ